MSRVKLQRRVGMTAELRSFASALRGLRNGAVFGTRIRAPHALVMTAVFRSGSVRDKITAVLAATFEHASNLAAFVFVYKTVLALGRVLWRWLRLTVDKRPGHPAVGWHAFVAGCIGTVPRKRVYRGRRGAFWTHSRHSVVCQSTGVSRWCQGCDVLVKGP